MCLYIQKSIFAETILPNLPDLIDQKQSAFPKYKTLGDALRARDMGDNAAQGWINQALNAASGDWKRAEKEYQKLYDA